MTTQTLTLTRIAKLEKHPRVPFAAALLVQAAFVLTQWTVRYRSRHELSDLDPHILADIGVTREEARKEIEKWFWQV